MLCFIIQKKTRTSLGQVHRSFLTDSWNCGFLKVINTRLKPQCFLSNDVSSIIIICWVGFSNNLLIWKRNIDIKVKSMLRIKFMLADNQSELNGLLETPAYNKICKRVLRPLIEIWKSSLRVRHEISLNGYLIPMVRRSYWTTFGILPAQWAFSWSESPFTILQLSQTSQFLIFDGHWITRWL